MGSMKGRGSRGADDGRIDATPPRGSSMGPRSIQDTQAFKDGQAGARRVWSNYTAMLRREFQNRSRFEQESLITRLCQVVTIGSAMLVMSLFYSFLPLFLRVFVLPGAFLVAYWAGTKIVSPIMIVRFDKYLNREF